jgi:geranylgeranyl diphosphate synthase type II
MAGEQGAQVLEQLPLSTDLHHYLTAQRRRVDDALRAALSQAGDGPASLREAMAYSLFAPGKRLRPMLVLLASEAAGGDAESALPAACAVEMVHTYSLIHDDLPAMDDDDLRRGLPTCHKQFGEALAILAGDALLTLAFQVLADGYPPATAAACCRELAVGAGAGGMVGGQVDDLAAETRPPSVTGEAALRFLEQIHRRKTGALYLASLRLGLLAAQGERPGGPDPAVRICLDRFGSAFGLAFQVTDDLLDVESDSARTGKRTQKDHGRNKLTYPGLLGVAESRHRAEELVRQAEDALQPLGERAARLVALTRSLVGRKV